MKIGMHTMITDRTQADVDAAREIREEKIKLDKNGQPKNTEALTKEDLKSLLRGTFTGDDLTRLSDTLLWLSEHVLSLGYYNFPNKDFIYEWADYNDFYKENFQEYIDAVNAAKKAFFTYESTPNTPEVSFHYEDINALEKILCDFETMYESILNNYRVCGTFECGEE